MGIMHGDVTCEEVNASIAVIQREPDECVDAWKIIALEIDVERMTPRELRSFGHWCIREGKRIGRTYLSNGKPRNQETDH